MNVDERILVKGMSDALKAKEARIAQLEAALQTIVGPEDSGQWIEVYRQAGGGYEGLQAVALEALEQKETP